MKILVIALTPRADSLIGIDIVFGAQSLKRQPKVTKAEKVEKAVKDMKLEVQTRYSMFIPACSVL